MDNHFRVKKSPIIVMVEMPDGREIPFYRMESMPIGVAMEYYKQVEKADKFESLFEQLVALSPGIDRDYLRTALSFQEAQDLIVYLAQGIGPIEKKAEPPTETTSSPDSVGTASDDGTS